MQLHRHNLTVCSVDTIKTERFRFQLPAGYRAYIRPIATFGQGISQEFETGGCLHLCGGSNIFASEASKKIFSTPPFWGVNTPQGVCVNNLRLSVSSTLGSRGVFSHL